MGTMSGGDTIRQIRAIAGWSRKYLGKKLNIQERYLYDMEIGSVVVPRRIYNRLERVLETDLYSQCRFDDPSYGDVRKLMIRLDAYVPLYSKDRCAIGGFYDYQGRKH